LIVSANSVPAANLRFDVEKKPSEVVVRGKGKINTDTIGVLHQTFRSLLVPGIKTVVFDLSEISYIDSSGLGALLGVYISAQRAGCELQVSNLTPRTEQLLSMARLTSFFKGQ
jgi:anti-sigma B factor antagonist